VLVLFWLDLITHTPNQNPTVSPETYSPWWVEKQLQRNPAPELGQCRAMVSRTARETLRQNWLPNAAQNHLRNRLAAWADLNLLDDLPEVDGFFSLAPREIWQVTELFYSQLAQEHPGLLDFLAAAETTAPGKLCDWVARRSALPFVTTGQSPMFAEQSGAFDLLARTNLDFSQVVILPSTARTAISATSQSQARVGSVRFANQKVSFETDSPDKCLVVISQTYYPGWKAYIDGRPQRLWRANYAFQALEAPAGKHQVVLIYTDHLLLLGLVLSATGSLVCAVWWKVGGTAVHPAQFS
jgi:hypothetical protein